ncbi:hypothetical protein Tco_0280623 [Tanacetum coccineum]
MDNSSLIEKMDTKFSCSYVDGILVDGASWSIDIDISESTKSTVLGAAAIETGKTAIVGGLKYSSNIGNLGLLVSLTLSYDADSCALTLETGVPVVASMKVLYNYTRKLLIQSAGRQVYRSIRNKILMIYVLMELAINEWLLDWFWWRFSATPVVCVVACTLGITDTMFALCRLDSLSERISYLDQPGPATPPPPLEDPNCFWDVLDDMTGLANLTIFFLLIGVTTTYFSLEQDALSKRFSDLAVHYLTKNSRLVPYGD